MNKFTKILFILSFLFFFGALIKANYTGINNGNDILFGISLVLMMPYFFLQAFKTDDDEFAKLVTELINLNESEFLREKGMLDKFPIYGRGKYRHAFEIANQERQRIKAAQ